MSLFNKRFRRIHQSLPDRIAEPPSKRRKRPRYRYSRTVTTPPTVWLSAVGAEIEANLGIDRESINPDDDWLASAALDDDAIEQVRELRRERQPKLSLYHFIHDYGLYGTGWDEIHPRPESLFDYLVHSDNALLDSLEDEEATSFMNRLWLWLEQLRSQLAERKESRLVDERMAQLFEAETLIDDTYDDINFNGQILSGQVLGSILSIRTNAQGKQKIRHCLARLTKDDAPEVEKQQALNDLSDILEKEIFILPAERREIQFLIYAELFGLGIIEPLLADDSISEIYINGPKEVFVERRGRLQRAALVFDDDDHVIRMLDRIFAPLGVTMSRSEPIRSARLRDGTRVDVILRPVALNGPTVSIRKFSKIPITIHDLIRFGSLIPMIAEFLRACVIAGLNTLVVGSFGSGRITLLNAISSFIPNDERIFTIENSVELMIQQEHVITLEAYYGDEDSRITKADLIERAKTMRADRIIVTDIQSDALTLIQTMLDGFNGVLASIASDNVSDALNALESYCIIEEPSLAQEQVRQMIARSFDVIVHIQRLRDGSRKITEVVEVQGVEYNKIKLETIFEFEQTAIEAGRIIGRIRPTGMRPKFMERIEDAGINLPPSLFGVVKRR